MVFKYTDLYNNENFTNLEQHIANYIVNNSEEASILSIQEIAKRTNTSVASISRFCKKLGTSGFKEFKAQLGTALNIHMLSSNQNISDFITEESTDIELLERIGTLQKKAISATQLSLSTQLINQVVHEIENSKEIYGIGISDSFIKLIDFQNKLLKINRFLKISFLQPEQTFLSAQSTSQDVAIVISYSGRSAEVVNACKILVQRGTYIIALTSDLDSPVKKMADLVIPLPKTKETDELRKSLFAEATVNFTINIIYAALYRSNFKGNQKYITLTKDKYLNK